MSRPEPSSEPWVDRPGTYAADETVWLDGDALDAARDDGEPLLGYRAERVAVRETTGEGGTTGREWGFR